MGELARIMGDDKLARPIHPFGGKHGRERDPSPLWDAWYEEFTPTDRRRCSQFMGGAVTPDMLASWLHCSVDEALRQWKLACELECQSLAMLDPFDPRYLPAEPEYEQVDPLSIWGPQELATALCVKVSLVHQWRKRAVLPEPFLVVSGVPLWLVGDVADWAADNGKALVA